MKPVRFFRNNVEPWQFIVLLYVSRANIKRRVTPDIDKKCDTVNF